MRRGTGNHIHCNWGMRFGIFCWAGHIFQVYTIVRLYAIRWGGGVGAAKSTGKRVLSGHPRQVKATVRKVR